MALRYNYVEAKTDGNGNRYLDIPNGLLLDMPSGRAVVIDGLQDGEEVFAIREQDSLALAMLNLYREMSYGQLDDEKAEELEQVIDRWIDWRRNNPRLMKDPS